jgi:hypothetical protein
MARAYGDRIRKRPPPRKVDLKRVHALADKLPRRIQILPTAKFAKKPMERVIVEQIVAENAAKLEVCVCVNVLMCVCIFTGWTWDICVC